MRHELIRSVRFTMITMLLCGGIYHVVVWGVGHLVFPAQAEGSLLRDDGGRVVGSRLIAQGFARPEYFHPRPSAVDYNAASTGGSNSGPSNQDHLVAVRARLTAVRDSEHVTVGQVPSELVTTSGAGLDPHLPKGAVDLQAPRIAAARDVPVAEVEALIRQHTERPTFGLLGPARVNVLVLNLALDERFPGRN